MQTITRSGWSGVRFGRPEVGASAERRRVTRASDIIAFTDMTGDRNPLHYDANPGGWRRIRASHRAGRCHFGPSQRSGGRGLARTRQRLSWGRVEVREGRRHRRGDRRARGSAHRAGRQAHLHAVNHRLKLGRRDLPVRHGDDLHSAARLGRWLRDDIRFFPCFCTR